MQHFQIQPLFTTELPGWKFSFYYKRRLFQGIYHENGMIEWLIIPSLQRDVTLLEKQLHDLMLFHVYDQ